MTRKKTAPVVEQNWFPQDWKAWVILTVVVIVIAIMVGLIYNP